MSNWYNFQVKLESPLSGKKLLRKCIPKPSCSKGSTKTCELVVPKIKFFQGNTFSKFDWDFPCQERYLTKQNRGKVVDWVLHMYL
jgi:hypothetical protein